MKKCTQPVHDVMIDYNGVRCEGRYSIEPGVRWPNGTITVRYRDRSKSTQVGRTPPESLARLLLLELVMEAV
jgi:hypothetical protein